MLTRGRILGAGAGAGIASVIASLLGYSVLEVFSTTLVAFLAVLEPMFGAAASTASEAVGVQVATAAAEIGAYLGPILASQGLAQSAIIFVISFFATAAVLRFYERRKATA
jgi:hypothetical protein